MGKANSWHHTRGQPCPTRKNDSMPWTTNSTCPNFQILDTLLQAKPCYGTHVGSFCCDEVPGQITKQHPWCHIFLNNIPDDRRWTILPTMKTCFWPSLLLYSVTMIAGKAAWANGCRMQMLEYRPSNDSPWKHIPVTTVHFLCDRTLEMRIPTHPKTQTTHVLQHLTEVCTSIK